MDKKNIKLVLVLLITFLITNGTFFALCEHDIVLDYINRLGNWSNAILLKSTYMFVGYAVANAAYNIDYVLPKVAHSLFVIKYVDKVNGWLGFSSKGELEIYLATAKESYSPLYKDMLSGFNNNIVSPCLGYMGMRPIIIEKKVPVFVNRPEIHVEYRDRIEREIVYQRMDNENILNVRESLDNLRTYLQQNAIAVNGLEQNFSDLTSELERLDFLGRLANLEETELRDICRLDNEWLPSNHQILRLVEDSDEFLLSTGAGANGIRVYYKSKAFFGTSQAEESLLISGNWLYNTYPKVTELLDGYSTGAFTHQLNISYTNKNIDPSSCSFLDKETQNTINLLDYLRNNALTALNQPQTNIDLLIDRVDQRLDQIAGRRSNQGSQTDNMSDRGIVLDQVEEFLDADSQSSINMLSRQDPSDTIFGVSSVNVSSAATMGTLGLIGTISVLPINDLLTIFSHFLGMSTFEPLLANPEAVKCLINIYYQSTGSVPGLLADFAEANPQDFASADFLNISQPSSISNSLPNVDGSVSYFKYIGLSLLVVGGFGAAWYLVKYGMDVSSATETVKTFKESLQDKYVNFK